MAKTESANAKAQREAGQEPTGDVELREELAALSYEQAREELVTTVRRLEAGNLPLEESLSLWKRGEDLADRCQAWLDGARETLEQARAEQAADD
ncbi:exodeoxyribonuclease VII small subunit [Brevibacterium sp. 5221]|uniref:Exodeoxyribonuclease 7 small subunit n=1 Tax=Brevibacterium rongguiense TaxID=2695267 RepID=A0A6N9H6W9_9MICO|nr:exodeoxyribonuclease VII small subunit [Brevibacterium rongguiense]MYM19655.1 exodeoxyribonuclease VII small subunit [Brevibacterium rongguiense]